MALSESAYCPKPFVGSLKGRSAAPAAAVVIVGQYLGGVRLRKVVSSAISFLESSSSMDEFSSIDKKLLKSMADSKLGLMPCVKELDTSKPGCTGGSRPEAISEPSEDGETEFSLMSESAPTLAAGSGE